MDIITPFLEARSKSLQQDPDICFIIAKSDNKNIVAYKIDDNKELSMFWQTWEEIIDDKPAIYKLSLIEKSMAFGFSELKLKENEIQITLNGYPSLPIQINHYENSRETFITFSNVKYRLLGIYAHIKSGIIKNRKPKGISLIVEAPIDDTTYSPPLSIYIDRNSQV